jgi:phosphopantetheine--protein transferase-like protein
VAERDFDIWCAVSADCPYAALRDRFLATLSDDERENEQQFVLDADRHLYLLAHALTRLALAASSGHAAERIEMRTRDGGKPYVEGGPEFSLSHARNADGVGAAVVAVSRIGSVGIDLEPAERAGEIAELVSRRYSAAEQRMLEGSPHRERDERIVWLWTAKEAVIKATGEGMRTPLESVSVEFGDDGSLRNTNWQLARFRVRDFLGTMATPHSSTAIRVTQRAGAALDAKPTQDFELVSEA